MRTQSKSARIMALLPTLTAVLLLASPGTAHSRQQNTCEKIIYSHTATTLSQGAGSDELVKSNAFSECYAHVSSLQSSYASFVQVQTADRNMRDLDEAGKNELLKKLADRKREITNLSCKFVRGNSYDARVDLVQAVQCPNARPAVKRDSSVIQSAR